MVVYGTRVTFALELKHSFTCFTIDKLFKEHKTRIIVGHEDGIVRTYDIPDKSKFQQNPDLNACYETKGGPIQALLVEDLTNLSANDLIVGNSRGEVVIFCNGQIMTGKDVFEHRITNMILVKEAGAMRILARDIEGTICSFNLYNEVWRMRHGEGNFAKEICLHRKVTCMFHAVLNTVHGSRAGYTLVADDSNQLSFYFNNHLAFVLTTPSVVTAMCAGRFVDEEHFEGSNGRVRQGSSPYSTQIVLGSDDGSLCMMANYQVYSNEIINVQFPVRYLCCFPGGKLQGNSGVDLIVAAGNSDCYCVIDNGKEVVRHRTPSWVTSMSVKDVNNDGFNEVIFSCKDLSIHAHKLFNQ